MKITRVEPIHISVPYRYGGGLQKADGIPWHTMETLLLKVDTDAGVTGWGEAFGFSACGLARVAVERALAPLATGRNVEDIAALMTDLSRKLHNYGRNGSVTFALSALDIALWDIAGQVAGKPLHVLLGGEAQTRVPAYASLLRYGDAALVARYSAEAAAEGYRHIKLHENGFTAIAAARGAIGPGLALMVDTNCPWNAEEAIASARAFAPLNLTWLEEPVWPPEDVHALARVRREGGVPIAAGENGGTFEDMRALLDIAGVDYVQPSVIKIGGVSVMLQVAALARARGKKIAPHSPYFGPGLIATAHLCAAVPEKPPVERFYCQLEASPFGEQVNARDGFMALPQGPGLGLVVDDAVIEKYRVG
jgi:L-alanine-DL-glutamate epimerase-like enolase superfamily enzyme